MSELLHQFGIDWKLLLAQAVNFFILLVILRVFAYKPILEMLKKRRLQIEEGIRASEESKRKLSETETREKEILLKAEQHALVIASTAEQTAMAEEARLLAEAHKKSEDVLVAGRKKLDEEAVEREDEFLNRAHELVRTGIAKVAAKAAVHDSLVEEAIAELKVVAKKS